MSSNERSPQKPSTRGTSRKTGMNPIPINTTQDQSVRDTQYSEEDFFPIEDDPYESDPPRPPSSAVRLNKPSPIARRSSRDARDDRDVRETRDVRDGQETRETHTETRRPTSYIPPRRTYKPEPTPLPAPVAVRPTRSTTAAYEVPHTPTWRTRKNVHWLIYVGVGMLAAVALYTLGSALLSWGTNEYNNIVYGYPRTYQTDAVVGHNDSTQDPSHFIAVNLHGQIIVFELPGGNPSKSIDYIGPLLAGPNIDQLPVTLSFAHVNNDKRLDMIVHIPGRDYIFCNTGAKFAACNQSTTSG